MKFPAGAFGNGAGGPGRASPAVSARVWQGVAFALVLVASVALLFLPLYADSTASSDGGQTTRTATLLQENSSGVLIVLAVPLLLTAVPLCSPPKAWRALSVASLIALATFVLISLLTIGWFYLPALAVSLVAALRPLRRMPGPTAPAGD